MPVAMTPGRYLDDAQGRLAYWCEGSGSPVLLVQGVGVAGGAWRPQIEALVEEYACLWFDNRGIGASQPVPERITVAGMVADALALMDARGWPDAHVIGHSLGGVVAQRLALTARTRVRSLSLLCTMARGRDAGASLRMAWIGLRSRVGTRRMRRAAFLEILAPPGALDGRDSDGLARALAPLFGHDLADHPPVEMRQLAALRAEDTTAELDRLGGLPTLVVSGAHDPIAPPALGRALAEAIPGAQFECLADQAHGAPILAPGIVNRLLTSHLRRAEAGPRSS